MSFPLILAEASTSNTNFFFVLFLAFAIAAIVWLLLWLFSEGDSGEYSVRSGADDGSSSSSAEEEDSSDDDDNSAEDSDDDSAEEQAEAAAVAAAASAAATAVADDNSEEDASDEGASAGSGSADSEDTDDGDEEDDFEAATEEEAAKLFASELEDGVVTQDPVYGIIYKEAPSEIDDLKEIKGVAKVLEGKLNGIGVYRFKQVAVWTDAACAEFSKMLTFKNRIYTDNWLDQAKDFHEKKYGEKL